MSYQFNPFTGTLDIVGGSGVQGPSSSVDSTIALFSGTSGQLLKDSGVTIDSNNYVYAQGYLNQNNLPSGVTLTIGSTQQMIQVQEYYVSGTLILEGVLLIL